jgi:hypothetical protein
MGFFKDVHQLNKMGKEASNNWDAQGQRAAGMERMAAAQQAMAAQNQALKLAADGIDGTASVLESRQTGALVNFDPMVSLDLLVTPPDGPPYPVTVELLVPQVNLGRIQPGSNVGVSIAKDDRSTVAIDWMRVV